MALTNFFVPDTIKFYVMTISIKLNNFQSNLSNKIDTLLSSLGADVKMTVLIALTLEFLIPAMPTKTCTFPSWELS